MKTPIRILTLAFAIPAIAVFFSACSEEQAHDHDHEDHDHEHVESGEKHEDHDNHAEHGEHEEGHSHEEREAGPNGGRVFTSVEPHLEFFVLDDKKVQITAVDESGKAVPVTEQSVSVIGGDRSSPTRLNFTKQGDVLVSDIAFPEGDSLPVVVQITPTPESVPVTEKFNLNLEDCPTCDYKEYACICDHSHEGHDHDHDEEGHDHKEKE